MHREAREKEACLPLRLAGAGIQGDGGTGIRADRSGFRPGNIQMPRAVEDERAFFLPDVPQHVGMRRAQFVQQGAGQEDVSEVTRRTAMVLMKGCP